MTHLDFSGSMPGRFEILAEQGEGGMSLVYRARQTDLDRIVALKILRPELSYDTATVARFQQEARSAARLDHPNIVPIYDIGEFSLPSGMHLHYIAMKYIHGRTVKELLQDEGPLSVQRAADLLTQVGAALEYAHQQGMIHRDIKPSNMLLSGDGTVYLGDFGLACGVGGTSGLTKTGLVMGTPEYMSPEQVEGRSNIGPASDIYALGVVLYEMLTGNLPFHADTPMAVAVARLMHEPPPLHTLRADLPPALEEIITRALSRDPSERFGSVAEMVMALRGVHVEQLVSAVGQMASSYALPVSSGPTIPLPQQMREEQQPPATSQRVRSTKPVQVPQAGIGRRVSFALVAALVLLLLVPVSSVWMGLNPLPDPPPTPIAPPTPAGPRSPEFRNLMARGWTDFAAGSYDEAAQSFAQAASLDSSSAEPFYGRGRVMMARQDFDQAVIQFRQAVERDSSSAEIYAWLGESYLLSDQSRESVAAASEAYQQAINLDSRQFFAMTGLGWTMFYQDDYEQARAHFEESLQIENNQSEAHNGLAWTLYTLQDYQFAYAHFHQSLNIDSQYVNAYYGLGLTCEALGKQDEARRAYQSVLQLAPGHEEAQEKLERLQ